TLLLLPSQKRMADTFGPTGSFVRMPRQRGNGPTTGSLWQTSSPLLHGRVRRQDSPPLRPESKRRCVGQELPLPTPISVSRDNLIFRSQIASSTSFSRCRMLTHNIT